VMIDLIVRTSSLTDLICSFNSTNSCFFHTNRCPYVLIMNWRTEWPPFAEPVEPVPPAPVTVPPAWTPVCTSLPPNSPIHHEQRVAPQMNLMLRHFRYLIRHRTRRPCSDCAYDWDPCACGSVRYVYASEFDFRPRRRRYSPARSRLCECQCQPAGDRVGREH
jgi:hypothetical protein